MARNTGWLGALTAIAIALLLAGPALSQSAGKRVALVIGNSTYQNVNPLPNPAGDATSVGDLLRKAGFDVVDMRANLSGADMRRLIRDFSDKVTDADIAVVFYAGHGIEVDGTNYLLPVDTRLERDIDVEDEAIPLERVVRIVEPAKKLRLIILDACRDNPFAKTMKRSLATRGIERGLAKVEPTSPNTLIAYAAKAGSSASDGAGEHSPFTTALLAQLAVPGQDVRRSFGFVRDAVLKATDNKQEPFVYGSLGGEDVTLVPAAATPAPVPAQVTALDPTSQLRRDYELAAQVNTRQGWDAFIAAHASGFYADLAKAARSKLDGAATVAALPADKRSAGNGVAAYVGKSYRLTFNERQEQITPQPGKISTPPREIVIFVKSAEGATSRITQWPNNPAFRATRYANSQFGWVDRGIQVLFDQELELVAMAGKGSYRIKAAITASGNTCKGRVAYELMPGKTVFEMQRVPDNIPTTMKTLAAENLACWVSPGDLVGEPPVAEAKPK